MGRPYELEYSRGKKDSWGRYRLLGKCSCISAKHFFFFGLLCDLLASENRPLTVIFAEYNQLRTEIGRMTAEFSGVKRAHPGFCYLRKSLHQPKTRRNKFSGKEVSGILMG